MMIYKNEIYDDEIKAVKNLCENLTKWKNPKNQTDELISEIHFDAQGLENDSKNYSKDFWDIDYSDILNEYKIFNIKELVDFKWVNDYCLKWLDKNSEAAKNKYGILKGGI